VPVSGSSDNHRRRGRTVMQLGANEPPRHTRLGVRVPPPPQRHPHGGRGVTATQWSVTPQLMGSTPSDRPKALVAQWIAHRFPEPEVAGSNPAKGARQRHTPVAQRIERQFTKLEVGVRFSPGVLTATLRRREHGWLVRHAYNVTVAGSIPARRTAIHHCRISSTGQSTCFVTRPRGFDSCIRLHAMPPWKAAPRRRSGFENRAGLQRPQGSTPLPSATVCVLPP
jgi:hypothetical protein